MCIGGSAKAAAPETAAFEDAPPVVTGKQTGVEIQKIQRKLQTKN